MPELPEVEISRRGIEPWLIGYSIIKTEVRNTHLRYPVDNKIIMLQNQIVLSVQRRGKYLLLEFQNGWIIIHFGMSGYLCVLTQPQPPKKHDHIDLIINNGCIIRYTDYRRFGAWLWSDNIYRSQVLTHLGPEPLSNIFNGYWIYQQSRNKRVSIKPWLMNNKIVVGIGNIYANESLFTAKISPNRIATSLSEAESEVLANSIKKVLLLAIEQGGTTLRNFLQSNGKPGFFTQKLQVYGRGGQPCLICGTLIQITKHSQRSTFFCSLCQR